MDGKLERILKKKKYIVIDGAIGTELKNRGCKLDDNLWTAKLIFSDPKSIRGLHEDYLNVGVDIIKTCSYQISFKGFVENGLSEDDAEKYLKESICIAKRVRDEVDKNKLVACCLSCIGASITNDNKAHEFDGRYVDTMSEKEVLEFHKRRLMIVIDEKPDIILFETFPALKEVIVICKFMDKLLMKGIEIPKTIFSFCCKDDDCTYYGDRITDCSKSLNEYSSVFGIGINCTLPKYCISLVKKLKTISRNKKIHCCPNSGEEYDENTKFEWKELSKKSIKIDWGNFAKRLKKNGCDIIGGCCRTRLEDIKQMVKGLKSDN